MVNDYQVDLDVFRGPLDLLLYLVKRNEVDICDIPIATVAVQFNEYLQHLQMIDVERAGEFLVMASTLMEIKSKMLLPRSEESTEEEDDPRRELVRQLLQYKKFKDAAALLEAQAEEAGHRLARQVEAVPATRSPQAIRPVELWDLVSAFGRLMRETLSLQPQQITLDTTPIHLYMEQIVDRLRQEGRLSFSALFTPPHTRGRLVGLLLAVLELIKARQALAEQPAPFGDIVIGLREDAPPMAPPEPEPSSPEPRPE